MNDISDYKAANVKKYSRGLQRLKFSSHPTKAVGLERFKRYSAELVGKNEVVLDDAGGSGMWTDILREQNITDKIYALDISASVLKERDLRDICVVGDMEELPYPDGFFDRVLIIGSLHHVGNTKKALDQAHRVLKPNGRIVLSEPVSLKLWLQGRGIRPTSDPAEFSFSLPYLKTNLKQSGFEVERVIYHGFILRFLPKAGVRTLRIANQIEELVNFIPVAREIFGVLSNYVYVVARKTS